MRHDPTGQVNIIERIITIVIICAVGAGCWFFGSGSVQRTWESRYTALQGQADTLAAQVSDLQAGYASLQQAGSQLQAEKTTLQANYASLQQDNSQLQTGKATLQAVSDSMMEQYGQIRDAVNLRQGLGTDRGKFVTPDDTAVAAKVQAVTGGFSDNVSEQWADFKLMYDWMIADISYSYDSPLPFLPPSPSMSELSWRDEYWRMPGETLEDETGDCEDMATLLASMVIKYSSSKGYPCWVIGWDSEGSGHAAVAFPVQGGKLTILDPAGKYYTGAPYSLSSESVSTAVNHWLAQWPGETSIHVDLVFSNTFYETFDTTAAFVDWALAR